MKNKKGFTLMEMIIVIVIIAILLSLSMRISSDRIQVLKTKSVQEQFIYNYNNLFSKNMLTNYHNSTMYENMIISLEKDNEHLLYGYKKYDEEIEDLEFEQDFVQGGSYKIEELKKDGTQRDKIDITFTPYTLGCEISDGYTTGNNLQAKVVINNTKEYCFQIFSNLCKQEMISCE